MGKIKIKTVVSMKYGPQAVGHRLQTGYKTWTWY